MSRNGEKKVLRFPLVVRATPDGKGFPSHPTPAARKRNYKRFGSIIENRCFQQPQAGKFFQASPRSRNYMGEGSSRLHGRAGSTLWSGGLSSGPPPLNPFPRPGQRVLDTPGVTGHGRPDPSEYRGTAVR